MSLTHLGRYEIVGNLGRGAMGMVYKARDPLIERTVAIKTVACGGLSRDEVDTFERRFYREAKSAGRLNHPNIVTIHDVGRDGELAYIAMEFLEGSSLREVLDSGVALPAERIADIAAQVADGLAFAHANDVVHRDIKPANVMVLDNGTVKIADFGVALLPTGSLTHDGTVIGSPKYMSPEQVTGQAVDGRSDVFSLGAVLYEMLTGLPPFAGDDLGAILYQVLNVLPVAPSSRRCNLHPGFDAIVARAMAKDPAQRYQSAEDLAADLRSYRELAAPPGPPAAVASGGAATVTPPPAIPAGSAMPRQRRRWKAVGAGAVALLLAVVMARWLQPAQDSPPTAAAPTATPEAASPGAPAAVASVAATPADTPAAKPPSRGKRAHATAAVGPPKQPPPSPREAAPLARLQVDVSPGGEIFVDNRRMGVSPPLQELELPPGPHVVEIRNAKYRPYRERVVLTARKSTRISHRFQNTGIDWLSTPSP